MSDDEAVWDSSFPESTRTLHGSDFDVSFSDIRGEEVEIASAEVMPPPPTLFVCERCKKTYKTEKGLKSHTKLHKLKDAALLLVNTDDLRSSSHQISTRVLNIMLDRNLNGPPGVTLQDCCVQLLPLHGTDEWRLLVEEVTEHIILHCIPMKFTSFSALHNVKSKVNDLLCDQTFIQVLHERCTALGVAMEPNIEWLFLGCFVRRFADEVFLMLLKSLRHPEVEPFITEQPQLDLQQKQLYHFIAGCVVKSLLRRGFKLKRSYPKWSRVISCIEICFRESGFDSVDPDVRQWTELVDRGDLTYVGQKTLEFFYLCGSIAKGLTSQTRYNLFQQVYQNTHLICLWDDIVSGMLPADESSWLMEYMCRLFYNTYAKGLCNKIRNNLLGKGQISVSTRKRLAK